MKVEHTKVPLTEFKPNHLYQVGMNGQPLYLAKVVKFHGGCWATVSIEQCLYDAMAAEYPVGREFEIKVAMYEIEPVESDDNATV